MNAFIHCSSSSSCSSCQWKWSVSASAVPSIRRGSTFETLANLRRRRRPFGVDVPVSFSTFSRQNNTWSFRPHLISTFVLTPAHNFAGPLQTARLCNFRTDVSGGGERRSRDGSLMLPLGGALLVRDGQVDRLRWWKWAAWWVHRRDRPPPDNRSDVLVSSRPQQTTSPKLAKTFDSFVTFN